MARRRNILPNGVHRRVAEYRPDHGPPKMCREAQELQAEFNRRDKQEKKEREKQQKREEKERQKQQEKQEQQKREPSREEGQGEDEQASWDIYTIENTRNEIYELALIENNNIHVTKDLQEPGVLSVNRQIRSEAREMW
ncbi:hypothetical protein PRZ48_012775 [Zasmidium cellare]|uniref:Uncharacterized protein n=1 Tax=Zasmidium cellare TaxID=395010 RepID=A0ABR0E5V5_ZASCE|nr:hypothetical protein PRZ48_012775 [Zasmidium cellare]